MQRFWQHGRLAPLNDGLLRSISGDVIDRTVSARAYFSANAQHESLDFYPDDGICKAQESGGYRCELPIGHDGGHACPNALAQFLEARAPDRGRLVMFGSQRGRFYTPEQARPRVIALLRRRWRGVLMPGWTRTVNDRMRNAEWIRERNGYTIGALARDLELCALTFGRGPK